MKNRILALILILTATLAPRLAAQVTVDVKLDSVQFWVGQQDGLDLIVSLPVKARLTLPGIKSGDELMPDLEVVEVMRPDTTMLDEGKRMEIHQRYIITAWDSSFYYLPPLPVIVDGKTYESKRLALKVYTIDVDTLHADRAL